MTKPTLVFEPGSCIAFTDGEYSDFSLNAILIARQRLDLRELGNRFKVERKDARYSGSEAEPSEFAGWLCAQGLAMDANYTTVHCGSYGSFRLEDNE